MKGGTRMQNKKGQSEVITTVLIILLVLAAIVIVWQVVNSTVSNAAEEVEAQSECLEFMATLGELKIGDLRISGYPNKAVQNLTFYVNGRDVATSGALTAGKSFPMTTNLDLALKSGDVVTAAGMINGKLCDGKVSQKV